LTTSTLRLYILSMGFSYKTLEQKSRFHQDRIKDLEKRIEYHKERKAEWDRILSEIQKLNRIEQLVMGSKKGETPQPVKAAEVKGRNEFARQLLEKRGEHGITPGEVRAMANAQGFPVPTNYPYKMFSLMVKRGDARKDKAGFYYLTEKK